MTAPAGGSGKGKKHGGECVKVVVRCRPLASKEIADGRQRIVDMDSQTGQVTVRNPKMDLKEPPKAFTFDQVFDWNSTQEQVYEDAAKPIVISVLEGYNGTVFAYGQTGTGKTHTMEGRDEPADQRGIIPNAFEHIFAEIAQTEGTEFLVRASFLEIYNEEIRDLLAKNPNNKLELKESVETGVYVKDLTSFVVKGVQEIRNVLLVGKKNRTVGATLMNQDSSRSHSIFSITIETSTHIKAGPKDDGPTIRVGKLNLVDLAGSERQGKTGATGDRLKEATNINWSLSALGNVISALVDGKSGHIPYRDSKLTRLLQDSLGGNTKTVMVANLGPADYNFDETVSTLRYANRAKNIKNKPRINEDPKDAMLREFQEEIARLKSQLQQSGGGAGPSGRISDGEMSDERIAHIKEQMRKEMESGLNKGASEEAMAKMRDEIERKAREEMESMMKERERTEEEKKRIAQELDRQHEEMQRHYEELANEKRQRDELARKLKAMEDKLLHGTSNGENLLDKAERFERELQQKEAELAEKRRIDEEKQRKIAELEDAQLTAEERYSSLADEIDSKTKKLKRAIAKYQGAKAEVEQAHREMQELNEEFQREREDLLDSIRALDQQLRLKNLIIESFVPPEEVNKIMRRAHWDEDHERWILEGVQYAGNNAKAKRPISAAGQRRPISDYARIAVAMGENNPRFKAENILTMELDMPERTTYDYDGGPGNARVQATLNHAFADDGEQLFSDTLQSAYLSYDDGDSADKKRAASRAAARPKSARPKSGRPKTAARS
ncbi:Kinesin-like protein [Klebsormidium nitens]|uniref:Kinesin-like protein n=1 Tax=Klebsormidium nitens TaxID=105231 RepID=A0A1Y1IPN0_KLENI|nr:Kinesin-like protein [Klebsormidium nitens]|eukprot:GAQ91439.1 Kinesin-like protein [Klebsormidium nitens]